MCKLNSGDLKAITAAARMFVSEADADDLAQEAALRTARQCPTENIQNCRAFAIAMLRPLAADVQRRRTRRRETSAVRIDSPSEEGEEKLGLQIEAPLANPLDILQEKEDLAYVIRLRESCLVREAYLDTEQGERNYLFDNLLAGMEDLGYSLKKSGFIVIRFMRTYFPEHKLPSLENQKLFRGFIGDRKSDLLMRMAAKRKRDELG